MVLRRARLIVLPDRHLLPIGVPLMLPGLLPPEGILPGRGRELLAFPNVHHTARGGLPQPRREDRAAAPDCDGEERTRIASDDKRSQKMIIPNL